MLKNQLFGVEVEFTGITRTEATEIVAEVLSSTASPATGHPYYTRNIKDAKGRTWKIQRDGSIVAARQPHTLQLSESKTLPFQLLSGKLKKATKSS